MPTSLLTGTQVAQLTTEDIWLSGSKSCADVAENFVYWYRNNGELYEAALPNLTGKRTITTVPNYSDIKATAPHPTNLALLVCFNSTDGVSSINIATGEIIALQSAVDFNALFSGSQLTLSSLTRAKVYGTKILLQAEGDNKGSVWLYDVSAGTATLLAISMGYQKSADIGPDAATELMLTGYGVNILYARSLVTDQIRIVAGIGTDGTVTDGAALTIAAFGTIDRMWKMADDLYYVKDGNILRWIQDGQVGSYASGAMDIDGLFIFLPGRNLVVSIRYYVTVWS